MLSRGVSPRWLQIPRPDSGDSARFFINHISVQMATGPDEVSKGDRIQWVVLVFRGLRKMMLCLVECGMAVADAAGRRDVMRHSRSGFRRE